MFKWQIQQCEHWTGVRLDLRIFITKIQIKNSNHRGDNKIKSDMEI